MRRDQLLVEHFLSAYNRYHEPSYKVVRWPEVTNRKTQAVEAVASNDLGLTIAIEHTLVEPFEGERQDTDRFMRVFSRLEGNPDLAMPGYDIDLIARVGAIPTGADWEEVGDVVCRQLALRIPSLEEGRACEQMSGVGFSLEIVVTISAHDPGQKDHVWISRSLPADSLEAVVRKALARKLPKLVREAADRRILLLEKADIACGFTDIRVALDRLSCEFSQLKLVDEVWLAVTHCWESEDAVFFYELLPELGGRRLLLEGSSTATARVKILGATA